MNTHGDSELGRAGRARDINREWTRIEAPPSAMVGKKARAAWQLAGIAVTTAVAARCSLCTPTS
jgi:hypothetical protein